MPRKKQDSASVTVRKPIRATVDGKEVLDLLQWARGLVSYCEQGRDNLYPGGFKEYMESCWKWYIGLHWDQSITNPWLPSGVRSMKANEDFSRVENRIAEKIDAVASILVQLKPDIKVLPRTDEDLVIAAQLGEMLDFQLIQMGLPRINLLSMKQSPQYGTAILREQHFYHREEPDGFDDISVCDPLSVAWEPEAKSLQDSKVIVEVELWDTDDAEAHFSTLTDKKIKNLPTNGEDWSEWDKWSLRKRISTDSAGSKSSSSTTAYHPRKTVITWIWYRDSGRVDESLTYPEDVENPEELGTLLHAKGDPMFDDEGKILVKSHCEYPTGRLIVLAGTEEDTRVIYDGTNPYQHGDFPYWPIHFCEEAGFVYGKPLAMTILDQQFSINEAIGQIASHASRCGTPPIEVNDKKLTDSSKKITNKPGEIIHVEQNGAVTPVIYPELNGSVLQNYELNSAAAERITGVSDVSHGESNASDSGIKVQTMDSITLRKLEAFGTSRDLCLERIGKWTLHNINQFMSPFKQLRISVDPAISMIKGDLLPNPENIEFDVVLMTGPGNLTLRQERMAYSREQAMRGEVLPQAPAQYSDIPITQTQPQPISPAAPVTSMAGANQYTQAPVTGVQ